MASERFWRKALQSLAANGTSTGVITVADVAGFKVKAEVVLKSNTAGPLTLQIKNIPNATTIEVGPASASMDERINVSAFLVSDAATITQPRQKRPAIGPGEIDRATYEEEPTVARRVVMVDEIGNLITEDNPLPVHLPDVTINAQLDVALDHRADFPKLGDSPDSVRIGDGIDELKINPDGSINVVIPPGAGGIAINDFSEISAVLANTLTDILTYTVPPNRTGTLFRIEVGGNNVATYELYINGIIEARIRTWFGTDLTTLFEFSSGASGFKLNPSDVVVVKVIHQRPYVGDFEARIQIQLQ